MSPRLASAVVAVAAVVAGWFVDEVARISPTWSLWRNSLARVLSLPFDKDELIE